MYTEILSLLYLRSARDTGEVLGVREIPRPQQDAKILSARLRLCTVYYLQHRRGAQAVTIHTAIVSGSAYCDPAQSCFFNL